MSTQKLLLFLLFLLASLPTQAQLDLPKLAALKIRNVGPANMSGRITTIDAR